MFNCVKFCCVHNGFSVWSGHTKDVYKRQPYTYLTLWNKIPPKEPNPFKAYICRIIKNLSLKKYEFNHAKKRNSEYEASLDELEECLSDGTEASEAVEFKELQMAINMFLSELPEKKRIRCV